MSAENNLSVYKLSDEEWAVLDKKFGNLCKFASWKLLSKNIKSSHTDDFDDIEQELKKSMLLSALYYKRQMYLQNCFRAVKECCEKDEFPLSVVKELETLWGNRTRHGAGKQSFGPPQEKVLQALVDSYVPQDKRPDVKSSLKMDKKFIIYLKSVLWNRFRTLGKKITKEKSLRGSLVSLSNYSYLANDIVYSDECMEIG